MSRIGKLPIPVLDKANVSINGQTVSVDGPKGKLEKTFDRSVNIEMANGEIRVTPADSSRHARAMFGTARSIINNMVIGVVDGYSKDLIIKGVGFRAALKGNILDLSLGYSHPVELTIPEGITVTVTENTKLKVEGADKQVVGEIAATIYSYFPAEPYKGKGVQIVGQYVRRKEGKKSA
ncbi:MAG: 50S ribosomal protein L6 [Opitutales bacterium]|jgi:large subunit ribosomal protein L6|nr:50S ribosomal protein L6 [Opitutales bacterium]MDP4644691.1 50S ribosomal protein L6 [Opitutales bacterium]MDP4693786.1 50S ribosomal protein L6 [Opitutales bacterium]MDP4777540.1 50S ribosomal protein L6 [Opitutales bacterium]MDP4879479.1 50S ribosomal protein L6 [Opitutales bacterium]